MKTEKNEWVSKVSLGFGIASVFLWSFSILPILAIILGGVGLVRENNPWQSGIGLTLGIVFLIVRVAQGA